MAETSYRLPAPEIVRMIDAPPPPRVSLSPRRDAMLLVDYEANPPLELLARPLHRLAGLRIDATLGARQRASRNTRLTWLRLADGSRRTVPLPEGSFIGFPVWSPDGSRCAFTRDTENGVELWVADLTTGEAKAIPSLLLNDVTGPALEWRKDSQSLLVRTVPPARGVAPASPRVPAGPMVEETTGKKSKPPTYQDLLRTAQDDALFAYYATSQLGVVEVVTGRFTSLGEPGIFTETEFSPDESHLLTIRLKAPYSHRVPYFYFARSIEVRDATGKIVRTVAELPVADDVPTQGVPTGPRLVRWQALHPARLLWVEALDGGDPLRKVPHRDALFAWGTPFDGKSRELLRLTHRLSDLTWLAQRDQVLLEEHDRDRRWNTTALLDLSRPAESRRVVFDLSAQDVYKNPGQPLMERLPDGQSVACQDGDFIYLAGEGASPRGHRPFLDRFNLATLAKERLFESREGALESVVAFVEGNRERLLLRHESRTEPPNYFIFERKGGRRVARTDFRDPAPALTAASKELLKYRRADGVELSGMLYLPAGYQAGTRLPTVIWAYPLEYSDASTAGQVRESPQAFTFFRGTSPLFFLTQSYAVLMNATMPVVGDPETMNNTYIEQVVGAARAAVDTLVERGVTDPRRVLVAGHSYGAFMTANLLAHSELFAAGIARSGAYNRTLTPFGFQSERRSLWEAPDIYAKVSPFMHAEKIQRPLLLTHGELDNNTGTHPIQSERLYQAIRGHGGTARLVVLPYESHGYAARESVLHVLAEMLDWAEQYVKNRPAPSAAPAPNP
jgi:dipeptidyl aminopeptidase/acylaminoacyl peptidase